MWVGGYRLHMGVLWEIVSTAKLGGDVLECQCPRFSLGHGFVPSCIYRTVSKIAIG